MIRLFLQYLKDMTQRLDNFCQVFILEAVSKEM
jgi:hypothetical protein